MVDHVFDHLADAVAHEGRGVGSRPDVLYLLRVEDVAPLLKEIRTPSCLHIAYTDKFVACPIVYA
jgi:hypothetical protein